MINRDFDTFTLMPKHNDMAAMVDRMTFSPDSPSFYLLNVGETHYPYALPGEPENQWPKIHGVHGVFKHLDDLVVGGKLVEDEGGEPKFFDQAKLDQLRARQVEAVRYLDDVFTRLFDTVPRDTYITVTADHGELFGEEATSATARSTTRRCTRCRSSKGKSSRRFREGDDDLSCNPPVKRRESGSGTLSIWHLCRR